MITRRTLEGALKCSLRDLRRELWRLELILVIVPVLWTSGGGWSVSLLSPGRLEKFERSLQSCFSICGAAQVWSAVSPKRLALAKGARVGLTDGSGSKASLKLMIVSLHVVMDVRESTLMLIAVRACFSLRKNLSQTDVTRGSYQSFDS